MFFEVEYNKSIDIFNELIEKFTNPPLKKL